MADGSQLRSTVSCMQRSSQWLRGNVRKSVSVYILLPLTAADMLSFHFKVSTTNDIPPAVAFL